MAAAMSTMQVMELPAIGQPLRPATRPVPSPGPGEVLVRVDAVGVCGSDLFLQDGGFGTPLPIVPGHEAAGTVVRSGPGVDVVEAGDQVALYYITADRDRFTDSGRPNISPTVRRMGVDVDGAFAEFVLRPAEALVAPGRRIDPAALAVLTDAVATPLHALKRVARVVAGETVVVLGIGGVGSNAVQLAAAMGARTIAVSRSAEKLELATALGAAHVIAAGEADPVAVVRDLTAGVGADVVVQCVGAAAQDEQAIAMGGPGGRVVLVGAAKDPFTVRAVDILWRELAVLGSRGFVPDDIRDAIALYETGEVVVDHLLGHVRPMAQANDALEDLRAGRVLRSVLNPR